MRTKFYPYQVIFLLFILVSSCKKDDPKGPDPILNISRTDIEVGNDVGYTDTVVIQSNIDWTISVSDGANAWLSVDPVKKAAGDSTIVTIKVTAANTSPSQTATLTITPAGSNLQPFQVNITRKAYSLVWQKCYGGSAMDESLGTALLPNGQFVTTGYSFSTDGDALGNTIANPYQIIGWALRAGSDGKVLWQKQNKDIVGISWSVVAASDGGTVITSRFKVVKLDANGNIVWSKSYLGSFYKETHKIINTADGGYLIAGSANSNDGVMATQGDPNLFVVKLDANGNYVWGKSYGVVEMLLPTGLAVCSDGGYVVCGSSTAASTGHGWQDYLIVKIDANGNKVWSKTYGGSSGETVMSIIGDTDGGCIVTGRTSSSDGDVTGRRNGTDADMWTIKLSKDGQLTWQVAAGGPNDDAGKSLVRLPDGNIAIGGYTNDQGIFNQTTADVWVVIMNNSGKIVWQKTFGSTSLDYNAAIDVTADGSILVTNNTKGNDGDVSGNHGAQDIWAFKLK